MSDKPIQTAEVHEPGLSVVVPIYNEEENVEPLCRRLRQALETTGREYEILLVDDGSTDATWDKLRRLATEQPHLRVLRLRGNFGQTAAMSAGFEASRGDVVVTLDADLQNDPEDIPRLLAALDDNTDVVSGWRRERQDPLLLRRLPSMLANRLISCVTRVHLHDYGCTLKAYRRDIVRDIKLYGEMHRFIPALASWVGGRVKEIPVRHHARRAGSSKYGIDRSFRVVLDLLTVKFLMDYSRGPMQIFGRLGALFGLPGLAMLVLMAVTHLAYQLFGTLWGADLIKRPFWIMTAFMLIFFGVQFVCMGLLAEILIRTWHESQNKPVYIVRETLSSPA